jgi:hypothetical protein
MSDADGGLTVRLVRATHVQQRVDPTLVEALSAGGAPTGEPAPALTRAAQLYRPRQQKRPSEARGPSPESRRAHREGWQGARAAAAALVDASRTNDPMARFVSLTDLEQALERMWRHHEERDVNWQCILNHAQGMLRQLFDEKRAELLEVSQCEAIRALVERQLGPATKSQDDLNEALRLIEDAGCDPYHALSGDPEKTSQQ